MAEGKHGRLWRTRLAQALLLIWLVGASTYFLVNFTYLFHQAHQGAISGLIERMAH